MRLLEDEIDLLTELDALRVRSAKLRDAGQRALQEWENQWVRAGDVVEDALHCRTLCESPDSIAKLDKLVQDLEQLGPEEIFSTSLDEVPVLRAARAMQALVAAPDSAFSETVVYCYYRTVRELYTPDAPEWIIGGAR
ncbi:MAG TPA: hypothetical protein VKU40_10780, partial [Thermoanaerobaculia bacterium]|nr:hypothetical protein [Thermoanaerobaculia bacterium]